MPARELLVTQATDAYLRAHEALVSAGVGPERPEAAKQLADAWLRLTREVKAWRETRGVQRG